MTSTRQKMYETNAFIKKFLLNLGFTNLYLFPHLRFQKGPVIEGYEFDAFGYKPKDTHLYLFQFKTNDKPTKKTLQDYKKIEKKLNVRCRWITKFKGGRVELFGETITIKIK